MNKEAYISELRSRLSDLSEDEIADAISYCEEYFDDAGEGNEQQVIDDLGLPGKFAAQIKADAVIRQSAKGRQENAERKYKKTSSLRNIALIIGGIFAFPIAIPLMIVVISLIFAFGVTLIALVFAGIITVGAVLFAGLPLLFNGLLILSTPGNALISIGGGLICIGLGLLMSCAVVILFKTIIPVFTNTVTRLYYRTKEKVKYEKA